MHPITKNIQNLKIGVIGDIILDGYIDGTVSRISPEAPIPILLEKNRSFCLGGSSNVAMNLASMGAGSYLSGRVGEDSHGKNVINLCDKNHINSSGIFPSSLPTILKQRIRAGFQQIVRIDHEVIAPLSSTEEDFVLNWLQKERFDSIILSDYGKGVVTPSLVRKVIETNIPTIIDPKSVDFSIYRNATLLKPNLSEAWQAFYHSSLPVDIEFDAIKTLCLEVFKKSQVKNLVVSLSQKGVALVNHEGFFHFEATHHEVADVSGAGDTMVAFLALGLHLDPKESVKYANIASGLVCKKWGTSYLSPLEWEKACSS